VNEEKQGVTQWQFYGLCVKVGGVLFVGVALFLLARQGDAAAIAILAGLGTLVLAGLGFGAALLIIDRQHQAEQRRFTANARENLAFLEQQARVQGLLLQNQGRASQSLLRQNEQLTRLIPSGGDGLDVDALSWDIREDSESEGRW
jgi:hypothetical protein